MNSSTVESGACVIWFGINIGNILNLKRPLSTLCKKANKVNSVCFGKFVWQMRDVGDTTVAVLEKQFGQR